MMTFENLCKMIEENKFIRDLATFNGFKFNIIMEDHWIKLYVYNKDGLYINRNFYLQDTYKFEKERDSIYNEILDFMKSLKEKEND